MHEANGIIRNIRNKTGETVKWCRKVFFNGSGLGTYTVVERLMAV